MSPEETKKMELEANDDFMKFVKLYKIVKVPLAAIKQKMKAEGLFDPVLMNVRFKNNKPIVIC